jgi:hypothetical protein
VNRLEERYRRVLRLLPAGYRRRWEEDMVAAFLASTATGDPEQDEYLADYGRPGAGEVASVVALATRLRFGGAGAPPRRYAWGQAVRLAVLLTTLTSAAVNLGAMVASAWLSGRLGLPVPAAWRLPEHAVGGWTILSGLPGWAWVAAYLALVTGHRRAARLCGVLAVLVAVAITALRATAGPAAPVLATLTATGLLRLSPWPHWLLQLLVVLGMGAFQPGTPEARRRGWLVALPAGVALVGLPVTLLQLTVPALRTMDWPFTLAVLTAAGATGYLLASLTGRPRRTPDRTLALLLLTAVAFAYRLTTLPGSLDATPAADRPTQLTTGLAVLAALAALAIPLLITTRRAWHRLPPDPDPEPSAPLAPPPHG